MFQFTGYPPVQLWIYCTVHKVSLCGFPHSDICGSLCICHSPQLFAAYHVFLRLSVPRHPPCALVRLAIASRRLPSVAPDDLFVAYWLLMSCLYDLSYTAFFSWYSVFKVRLRGMSIPRWRLRDSNSRPPACKAGALPAELSPLRLHFRSAFMLFSCFFNPAAACFPMPSPA